MTREPLPLWTVYDHPRDMPHCFVARLSMIGEGPEPRATGTILISDSLEPLREAFIAQGLTCIARSPNDDPVIVECWL
jgi:hypothetical protein